MSAMGRGRAGVSGRGGMFGLRTNYYMQYCQDELIKLY